MSKRATKRVGIVIDMTPMVDIAFLLLIFYMATTSFKPPERKQVKLAASHAEQKIPDKNIINVTVSPEDSIFIEYIMTAERLIEGRTVSVPERIYEYTTIDNFNIELFKVRARLRNPEIVVKADRDASYGIMRQIMRSMQEMKINQFSLITDKKKT
ncbi:MAG: biopolymer transporter ExbD [candidate division Zixibacteria bacterium]|nr:biopolymer transporter ExbD [candidate division Zixibacteria bacterium]